MSVLNIVHRLTHTFLLKPSGSRHFELCPKLCQNLATDATALHESSVSFLVAVTFMELFDSRSVIPCVYLPEL